MENKKVGGDGFWITLTRENQAKPTCTMENDTTEIMQTNTTEDTNIWNFEL